MTITAERAFENNVRAIVRSEKVRENRLRAAAKRRGYELRKSRRRDPRAADYEMYAIADPRTGKWEAGIGPTGYCMSLGDVEKWLTP
jgi:hypothetical protein